VTRELTKKVANPLVTSLATFLVTSLATIRRITVIMARRSAAPLLGVGGGVTRVAERVAGVAGAVT